MDMKEWVAREQVRALLHIAETPGESVQVSAETLAALCRTQLAVWDAPVVTLCNSYHHGWQVEGELPDGYHMADARVLPEGA